jgi:sugar phosphate isomerase/epimerase
MYRNIKFGICSELFKNWPWEKVVNYISSIGYDGVEIAPFTFATSVTQVSYSERRKIREAAKKNNLGIIGLHWLLLSPPGLSITSSDKVIREETTNYLKELINFCADLEGRIMVFGSPKQRSIPPGVPYEEAWRRAKECFLEILPLAKQRDVIIALEPLSRKETNFINTLEEALRMINEIKDENFRLTLDVKAMCDEGKTISEIISSSKGYLAHFHANDVNLLGPGFGKIDYLPIREALEGIGYVGWVSVEIFDFSSYSSETIAERSLNYLREVFKE